MSHPTPYGAIRSLLAGDPPDPQIRRLGPYTAAYRTLAEAGAAGGQPAVIAAYDRLAAQNASLLELTAGSPPWGGTPRTESTLHVAHPDELALLPPVTYLDEFREIPGNALTTLGGPWASGKSFLALDRALHIAQKQPVLYIAGEGGQSLRARTGAWCRYHQRCAGELYFIFRSVHLLDRSERDELADIVWQYRPALIIVDTLARCIEPGDENSAADMSAFVSACDTLRMVGNAAVYVIHHTGKNGDLRGSTALPGACDQINRLTTKNGVMTLVSAKSKDSAGFEPRKFRLEVVPTDLVDVAGSAVTSCVVVPLEARGTRPDGAGRTTAPSGAPGNLAAGCPAVGSPAAGKVLEALARPPCDRDGAMPKELEHLTGLPQSSLYKALGSLRNAGRIRQEHSGGRYFLAQ